MKHESIISWTGDMAFNTEIDGHKLILDTDEESGGHNTGMRPKKLMLTALAGCTAMDVISILNKMKIIPDEFNVSVIGNVTDVHPKQYDSMHIIYEFKGDDLPKEKLIKAIELSLEKYCGVAALYKKAINVTYELKML